MSIFPLVQILFYIAVSLAPGSAHSITLSGPDTSIRWVLGNDGWHERNSVWSVNGKSTVQKELGRSDHVVDVSRYVKGIESHDWSKEKIMVLSPNAELEKTVGGFVFRIRSAGAEWRAYQISY